MRLDKFLSEKFPRYSRSALANFTKSGRVRVDGNTIVDPSKNVTDKNAIEFDVPEKIDFSAETLPIIYEDENVIAINKPAGVLTHSKGVLNDEFTVAEFVRNKTSYGQRTNRPGIIHRLDRGTSGIILVAKNDETARLLQRQFADRKTKKTYLAIIEGIPKEPEARIDAAIGRNPKRPAEFRTDINGKSAVTNYKVLATNDKNESLIELKPETGRTHQLRVHMSFIGTPIKGDIVYGKSAHGERMFLHAKSLEITIPGKEDSKRETFEAPIPEEFTKGFNV